MTTGRLVVLMFVLFLIEGTLVPWFMPEQLTGRLIPHFTFVIVLYTALYGGRHKALVLGLVFGLLQDIVYYGHLLGIHSFSMGLLGYLTGLLLEKKRVTMMSALLVVTVCCLVYETVIYGVYLVFRFTRETYEYAMIDHILLSTFLQLGFALVVYVPVRRWVDRSGYAMKPENEEE
ncbi:rod shape-determining protein MreD [Paenibacillus curdlanolyticus YK9]|uniref:Rod shape-determining protein MreD n=1 Tax=Paenibacillus curdlanolyticus YK9 TaxID=717606 RepID=E0IDU9_9BACL|nr:rod shape-determining protein MreD [Paenibacillus curdlanolyticus]EFM09303.1 rod shape-determining protein MreD [Paenibacillus curdlanolyticus YK9]